MICISIVSHGHAKILSKLVEQLLELQEVSQIILTYNIPESIDLQSDDRMQFICNQSPRGFGANHNNAFKLCKTEFFCVLNPDILLLNNPFPQLLESINLCGADLIAPLIINSHGEIEDSIRYFPTISTLIAKLLMGKKNYYPIHEYANPFISEWVAGMFMLFKSNSFKFVKGFDEKFFLYYEDVDICVRLWRFGLVVYADPSIKVIHDARRASRSELYYMKIHLFSMLRYLLTQSRDLPDIDFLIHEKT